MTNSRRSKLSSPPLRAMQAFEAVARCGSVSEAAVELDVSAGAVSQQLRKLETALEVRLLERQGNRLTLTSWGRLYQREIAPAFERLHRAQDVLRQARTGSALVLSCLSSVATRWIGPRLFEWQARHPDVKVRLVGAEEEPDLTNGDVDFRITYGQAVASHARSTELFTDTVLPACAPSLLASRVVHSPDDLLALPLLAIEWETAHGAQPTWAEWAVHAGLHATAWAEKAASGLTFSLSSAAIDAAVDGHGVVLAQTSFIAKDVAAGRLVVPFDRSMPLPDCYFLAWQPDALEKPRAAELRDWLIAPGRDLTHCSRL